MSDLKELFYKLCDVLIDKKIIIYGLGRVGKDTYKILKKSGIEVDYFIVSDGYGKENVDSYDNVKVYEVSSFPMNKDEYGVLVTTTVDHDMVLKQLMDNNYKNIINALDNNIFDELLYEYCREYFINKGVNIENNEIKINKIKFLNPFKNSDKEYIHSFIVEAGDLIFPEVFSDFSLIDEGPYEYGQVNIKSNDIILDCGANIGMFSLIAASKGANVYSFEPTKSSLGYLKKNASLYNLINIYPYAVGEKSDKVEFYVSNNDDNTANTLNSNMAVKYLGVEKEKVIVDMITLDDFVKKNNIGKVDFIKADIEGSERNMLRGAQNILSKFAPKLSICTYHLKDDPEVIEDLIKKYNPNYIIEHKWKKIYAYVPK